MEPECVTPDVPGLNQLLYFTSPSLLTDDERMVYLSERDGCHNLFLRNLATGTERQLTSNAHGHLRSYIHFDGDERRGLGKACVDPERGLVYHLLDDNVCVVDAEGRPRVLAKLPEGQVTALPDVSRDGTRLCVPTTDDRALEGFRHGAGGDAEFDIDRRVREEKLSSYLRVFDTRTGELICCERVPRAWITHVQFSPLDAGTILYNHEWTTEDSGFRRMWLWDGHEHRRLRGPGEGRNREDWVCHEMWTRDGQEIIYHGKQAGGRSFLGRMRADGSDAVEIALPSGWDRYGHFTVGQDGLLTSDGYYETPDDPPLPNSGQWITTVRPDWTERRLHWTPLCRHGSDWNGQDNHPHPVFNHRGDTVYFTSNQGGQRAIYRVKSDG